jgi:uncharacterized protein YkwD
MIYVRRLRRVELILLLIAYVLAWATVDSWHYWRVAAAYVPPVPKQQAIVKDVSAKGLLNHANTLRVKAKVAPFTMSPALTKAAAAKCADMVTQKYWGQKDPKGADSWHFIKDAGVNYKQAANILSEGWRHTSTVAKAWQRDTGAKAYIVNSAYTQTGVAVCKGAMQKGKPVRLLVVQYFSN